MRHPLVFVVFLLYAWPLLWLLTFLDRLLRHMPIAPGEAIAFALVGVVGIVVGLMLMTRRLRV